VAHDHLALVDPLQPDRALDLDHAVVEVDEHDAVGEDALAPDGHVLEGRDRALLPEHGLGPDAHLALVHADLGVVPDPRPASQHQARAGLDLEGHPGAHEGQPVGDQPLAPAQLQPHQAQRQQPVLGREHAPRTQEAQQGQRPAVPGCGVAAHGRGDALDRRRRLRGVHRRES